MTMMEEEGEEEELRKDSSGKSIIIFGIKSVYV